MYPPKKPLPEGTEVQITHPATILGLENPENPYWYLCQDEHGTTHRIEIAQITLQHDEAPIIPGDKGSMTLKHVHYTLKGGLELYKQLQTLLAAHGVLPEPYLEYRQALKERIARDLADLSTLLDESDDH